MAKSEGVFKLQERKVSGQTGREKFTTFSRGDLAQEPSGRRAMREKVGYKVLAAGQRWGTEIETFSLSLLGTKAEHKRSERRDPAKEGEKTGDENPLDELGSEVHSKNEGPSEDDRTEGNQLRTSEMATENQGNGDSCFQGLKTWVKISHRALLKHSCKNCLGNEKRKNRKVSGDRGGGTRTLRN